MHHRRYQPPARTVEIFSIPTVQPMQPMLQLLVQSLPDTSYWLEGQLHCPVALVNEKQASPYLIHVLQQQEDGYSVTSKTTQWYRADDPEIPDTVRKFLPYVVKFDIDQQDKDVYDRAKEIAVRALWHNYRGSLRAVFHDPMVRRDEADVHLWFAASHRNNYPAWATANDYRVRFSWERAFSMSDEARRYRHGLHALFGRPVSRT